MADSRKGRLWELRCVNCNTTARQQVFCRQHQCESSTARRRLKRTGYFCAASAAGKLSRLFSLSLASGCFTAPFPILTPKISAKLSTAARYRHASRWRESVFLFLSKLSAPRASAPDIFQPVDQIKTAVTGCSSRVQNVLAEFKRARR